MPRMQECPAIKALREVLHPAFPQVMLGTTREKKGLPADRHTSGLAIDIHFDTKERTDNVQMAWGMAVVDLLVKHFPAMKWGDIIYTDFNIGSGLGGYVGDGKTHQHYSEMDHNNHIHVDWVDRSLTTGPPNSEAFKNNPYEWPARARNTAWRDAFAKDIQELVAAGPPAGAPASSVAPSWLKGWWKVVQDGTDYYYYFASGGTVMWTDKKQDLNSRPVANPNNRGTYLLSTGRMTIRWNETGGMSTVETFLQDGPTKLRGSSNRGGPLVATRPEGARAY